MITWIATRGEGKWVKGRLIGRGQYINENEKIMQKGIFNNNGRLNNDDCEYIKYSDSANVNIRKGSFKDGKESGTIYEYVFAKSFWEDLLNNNKIQCTKYTHTFSDGNWQSTLETKNDVSIKGEFDKVNGRWQNFGFREI